MGGPKRPDRTPACPEGLEEWGMRKRRKRPCFVQHVVGRRGPRENKPMGPCLLYTSPSPRDSRSS
eukprot:12894898-Alexandrium_andersonii.AAC.1